MKIQIKKSLSGFTLVEMAIVLIIFGLLFATLLVSLQAQRNLTLQTATESTLNVARKNLLGFAQQQGRLPCPATIASNGVESQNPPASGTCTQQVGFLPAATLGIQPTDVQGFAVDGWNNRIRYAVNQVNNAGLANTDFTTTDGMANQGIANLQPNLRVCSTSIGITASRCSAGIESNYLINNAAAVIYSLGATGSQAIGGPDETANLNDADGNGIIDDGVFVSHGPVGAGANEFDHLVTWISPFVLYNAMIEAGQLH